MDDRPTVEELEHLSASLTRDDRDQLLEELLVAAVHAGGDVTRSQPTPKVPASLVCYRLERPESGPDATDAEDE